jgi:DNA repair photolyase
MAYQIQPLGIGNGAGRASKDKNAPSGVRHQYRILDEKVAADGTAASRLLERTAAGETYRAQTKINAFNFPFTGNSGGGCFFQCVYCFLRQPFFQMHRTLPHGREMDVTTNFGAATESFLQKHSNLPQYMKRVQWGVATEMWHPRTVDLAKPDEGLRQFQKHGQDWMLHIVTKSPRILDWADLLAEMKHQVQVEVSFVTLNEEASRIFETGTPSVRQRLRIVEELASKGIFVRMMMMPCMREYELKDVEGVRHIVFQNVRTGASAPGFKRVVERDGNAEGEKVGVELYRNNRWAQLSLEESREWKPVIVKDWSELEQAQANWRNWGAKAYKQKDMNYFFVDELVRAQKENRAPKAERGRVEDPTAECLIHSGESVLNQDGLPKTVEVLSHHKPKKLWNGSKTPPKVQRCVMDYGYKLHSAINWIDCI